MQRSRSIVVAVIASGLLGCTRADNESSRFSLLVQRSGGELGDAVVSGYVDYLDRAGCFVATSRPDGSGKRYPVIWPKGTRVAVESDELIGVDVPSFGRVELGTYVSGGGRAERSGAGDGILPTVSSECLGETEEYFIFDLVTEASDRGP
jgi:hypothetical protein